MRVAGDVFDVVDGLEVLVVSPLVESQQRGVFEREHGEGRHQGVRQRDLGVGRSMVGQLLKPLTDNGKQGICGQTLTWVARSVVF